MASHVATIARGTLLEARRNSLPWLLAALVAGACGLAAFLGQLAVAEGRQLQAALLAAVLRPAAVFTVTVFVVTSMARELEEKRMEMMLALAMPRAAYLLGKLAGFCALAVAPAALFGALLLAFSPAPGTAAWTASLLLELWVMAAFALFCAISLRHVLPALAACAAFYLLARSIGAVRALGGGWTLDTITALLPRLDLFTRTDWLLYQPPAASDLLALVAQAAACVLLLASAGLYDLYRKDV
jgi:ABC-type transport system involved in multi-copper enzyme maturation permease subunit